MSQEQTTQSLPPFTPNEIVGYRIVVDSHNWNVALVKKHGPNSKYAGQEYAQILSHHKNLEHALLNIHDRTVRDELTKIQGTGGISDLTGLSQILVQSKAAVVCALAEVLSKLELSDAKIRQQLIRFGQPVENMEATSLE